MPYLMLLPFLLCLLLPISSPAQVWEWQNPLPQGNTLYDVQFIDDSAGWAVGSHGTVLKTVDGGDHWRLVPVPTSDDLNALSFVNAMEGWIAGGYSAG